MNRALRLLGSRSVQAVNGLRNISTGTPRLGSGMWVYRSSGEKHTPKSSIIIAEAIGGTMWFWMLYHLWHEPEHILGDFPFPDPSKWTDEELGIPPAE